MSIIKGKYTVLKNINKIAILADPGCREGWQNNFPRLLKKVWGEHHPELFIICGDVTLNSFKAQYSEIIAVMNSVAARWVAVPGDHDRPLNNFVKYFGFTHKVIDAGKWRFIGINTSNRMFLKKDAEWIKKNTKHNSVIFSHVPPEARGWTFHSLWPKSSSHFLDVVRKNHKEIKAMYFGHLHGFSQREFMGIPMIITGAAAESKVIRNNKYSGRGFLEMVIFNVKTSRRQICRMY